MSNLQRFVFSCSSTLDDQGLLAAKRVARRGGAVVLAAQAETMLLELDPARLSAIADALPGWTCSPERNGARVPERRPLERARIRRTPGAP